MKVLYACSSNSGKLAEFVLAQDSLRDKYAISPLPNIQALISPEENGATFEENAIIKALYYSAFTSELVFADDSGLEVSALGGAPGVLSAHFAGVSSSDDANNRKLLEKLKDQSDRTARFVTVIALAREGRLLHTVGGTVSGQILPARRGGGGFGYDPLFYYLPLDRSFAELSDPEKFAVSARGNAFRLLLAWLAATSL